MARTADQRSLPPAEPPQSPAVVVEVLPYKALPSPEDFERSQEDRQWQAIRKALKLTGRETQVLRGIFHGRKYLAIAADLGISKHTVDTHWRHIKAKLGVKTHVEAIHCIYSVIMELNIGCSATPFHR